MKLKQKLASIWEEALKDPVIRFLQTPAAKLYDSDTQKLAKRGEKWLNVGFNRVGQIE